MFNQLSVHIKSLVVIAKQLKIKGVMTALQSGAEFSQLIKPLGARPLIIAAHPGDEVMAMGGTMALYAKHKVQMRVLTLTAGRRGTNTGKLSTSLGAKRHKEQQAGFDCLGGVILPTALNLDEKFALTDELISDVLDYVAQLNPDIIYLPSLVDDHPDSQLTVRLIGQILQRFPAQKLRELWISQYELWTPQVPNKLVLIDAVVAKKQKAIECHQSQLLCRDYLSAMLGLGRYRAAMLGFGSNAEAFFICRATQFLEFSSSTPVPVAKMI